MNYDAYLEKNKEIYQKLLGFLDNEDNSSDLLNELQDILIEKNISKSKEDFTTLLYMILNISNNHYRSQYFFNKIEEILNLFKFDILQNFTNFEIFNIFKTNKRILLFLHNEQFFKFDKNMVKIICNGWYKRAKYPFYFYPEIKQYLNRETLEKMSNKTSEMEEVNSNEDFEENRKQGENKNYICKLIRNDEIENFVVYVNRNNYSLSSTINESIFETNYYLLNKELQLIEYAAFFGSIQIFKFLCLNKVPITSLIWPYSIHGRNPDIIHSIEDYKIIPIDKTYKQCFYDSVKCHHNEIANYFLNNKMNEIKNEILIIGIKSYNFEYFPFKELKECEFYFACKYNNLFLAKYILENYDTDLNDYFVDGNYINQTALNVAIKERHKDIVKYLISNENIDINMKTLFYVDGISDETRLSYAKSNYPLLIAVENEDEEIVKLLLSHPNIDVNIQLEYHDKSVFTVFHVAKTALNIAIEKENIKIVELLLNHPDIDVNLISNHNDGDYGRLDGHDRYIEKIPLILAIEKENIEIVSLLLKHPNINVNIISRYHDYEYEFIRGYQGNQYIERSPLHVAVEKNNFEIVQILLNHSQIDVNSILTYFNSNHNDQDEKKYKIDHYIYKNEDVDNNDGDTVINEFVIIDTLDKKRVLLHFDEVKFNRLNEDDYIKEVKTPLFISIENKNNEIAKLLLKSPKINVKYLCTFETSLTSSNITAYQKAKEEENSEIIQILNEITSK